MFIKSIKTAKDLKNKTILVRCDFDLPLKNGGIIDDTRIRACLPTIKYLLKKKAKVILIGHLGRPNGKIDKNLSLKPVKNRLERLLNQKIDFIKNSGKNILMLENLRFFGQEEKNSKKFAKNLAKLADIYVNEAFAVSHRTAASVTAIQNYLPSYAGPHLTEEVEYLSEVMKKPQKPFVLIIGGVKIETKLPVIKNFLNKADYILVGGAVANTFLKAAGMEMGKSLANDDYIDEAKNILNLKIPGLAKRSGAGKNQNVKLQLKIKNYNLFKNYKIKNLKIILPIDWRVKDNKILDIGPKTILFFSAIIKKAKTIVWNGPMGYFEEKEFAVGTQEIAKEILKSKAKVVIGGGDTDKVLHGKRIPKNIFISTGGGAMLEFLAGKKLSGFKKIF